MILVADTYRAGPLYEGLNFLKMVKEILATPKPSIPYPYVNTKSIEMHSNLDQHL